MEFKFDENQDFQIKAINACVNVFSGQKKQDGLFDMPITNKINYLPSYDSLDYNNVQSGVKNNLNIPQSKILNNLQNIQYDNNIESSNQKLENMNFTISMETGTGKTYVYLRTIFEMNRQYDFKKFIIVVPSVAIREGVIKSLQQMDKHFKQLYNNVNYDYFNYDSSKPQKIRSFAQSNSLQIMIINIDSFNKDKNKFNSFIETISGIPADFVKDTNPILIIDEPQNMETVNAQKSLQNLNPLATFGYSATHITVHNKLYDLNPVEAYNRRLVKKIEVLGNVLENNNNTPYIKLISVDNTKSPITAKLEVNNNKKITVKVNDDIAKKTKQNIYDGYIIKSINCVQGEEYINFTSQTGSVELGKFIGGIDDSILKKQQIKETIETHIKKQIKYKEKGIKVLSLFFIDKVSNYRDYTKYDINSEKAEYTNGKYAEWFEQAFIEILEDNPPYKKLYKDFDVSLIHNGYFSEDKNKKAKDTNGNTKADRDTYNLIMKGKERLLSFDEPLQFIFSHSALREGWDNPNVFQICTLNETSSKIKKRQELGRGMRLCVNQKGERVFDENINKLTVVCNESYEDFADKLQKEYEDETGKKFEKQIVQDGRNKAHIKLNEEIYLSPEFKELWNKIKQKTKYKINYQTKDLLENCKQYFNKECNSFIVDKIKIITQKTEIEEINKYGLQVGDEQELDIRQEIEFTKVPDILSYIQTETYLSRQTIAQILKDSNTLDKFKINPQQYMDKIAKIINKEKLKLILDGIQYQKTDEYYDQELLDPAKWLNAEIVDKNNHKHISSTNTKHLYDYILCDSNIEKNFAEQCIKDHRALAFTKLPSYFKIKTPLGTYNPDWAILRKTEDGNKLYFVVETKGKNEFDELSINEKQKIICARNHFKTVKDNDTVIYEAPVNDYERIKNIT